MPIHDQGYRRYGGSRTAHGRAWWVIARAQILTSLRYKPFIVLLLFAWSPFLVRAVQVYLSSSLPQMAILAATPQTFREFLDQQSLFVFLVTIAMAGQIADDRRANALQVYLSKPLTRVEYVAGKLVPPLVFVLGVTFLPGLLLLLLQMLFAGTTTFVRANLFLIPAITLFSIVQALLSAFAILALSSLTKSRRFVAVMYAGVVFFTAAMAQALRQITASERWSALSPEDLLDVLGDAMFRVRGTPPVPVWTAALLVALLVSLFVWILHRRVRGIEVVT